MLKKTYQKGFTIVELLIVIVVIGILAALVLNTFAGVQQRARDTERTTDVKAIASQLEVFYADNGFYPLHSNLNDATWRGAPDNNMPGIDDGAFIAPQQETSSLASAATEAANPSSSAQYLYWVGTDAGGDCSLDEETCQRFQLKWDPEQDDEAVQAVQSLN